MDDRPHGSTGPPGPDQPPAGPVRRQPVPPRQHDGFLRAGDVRDLRRSMRQGQPFPPPQQPPQQPPPYPPNQPPPYPPRQPYPPQQQPSPQHQPSPQRPAGPARPADHDGRRGALTAGKAVLAMVSVLVLALTGYGWATFQQLTSRLTTTPVIGFKAADGATDILLVGSDSRTDAQGNPLSAEVLAQLRAGGNEGELTDTLMLVRIPNDGRSAVGISIPRDTFVDIPGGYGKHKINSAYGRAKNGTAAELRADGGKDAAAVEHEAVLEGRRTLVKTVESLTGAGVDHYAEVNLLGFYEITQSIGGVEVCLNNATRDPESGANFKAGRQTIAGADALAFVRQRKNLPRGDLDRIVRQQVFLSAVTDKVLSAGTLTSPGKLRGLIDSLQRSVVLDDKLDPLTFAEQMRGLASGAVQFVTIPVVDVAAQTADGASVTVDRDAVRQFVKDYTGGAEQAPTANVDNASITVDVRNASGVTGLAGRVLDELTGQGFARGETANATARATSVVRFADGEQGAADMVAQALGGLPTEPDANLPAGRVRVFLGEDYRGPGAQRLAADPLVRLDGSPALRQQQPTSEPPVTGGDIRCVD